MRTLRMNGARQIKSIMELKKQLQACSKEKDITLSKLLPIGLLSSFLAKEKVRLIVYGGAAIEYYLSGGHSANDVDIKCSNMKRVTEVLCNAGFTRSGEVFWHTNLRAPIQLCDDDGDRRTSISVKGY